MANQTKGHRLVDGIVAARISGLVAEVHVLEGAHVDAGAALVTLDTELIEIEERQARARLAEAEQRRARAVALEQAIARVLRDVPVPGVVGLHDVDVDGAGKGRKALHLVGMGELLHTERERDVAQVPVVAPPGRKLVEPGQAIVVRHQPGGDQQRCDAVVVQRVDMCVALEQQAREGDPVIGSDAFSPSTMPR